MAKIPWPLRRDSLFVRLVLKEMKKLRVTLQLEDPRPRRSWWRDSPSRIMSWERETFRILVCLLPLFNNLFILISQLGNFGFGIEEHIDLGIKYDPYTGIFGMDFYVVLTRAGKRVQYRKAKRARMGLHHKVTREEAIKWFE